MTRRTFIFVALGLLAWALVASLASAYYYYSYNDLYQKTREATIHMNLGINYGNGTIQWYNQTEARSGDTLLEATLEVAEVYYETSAYGAFVKAINGVNQPATKSWIWWKWTQQDGWESGQVGSDAYILGDNEILYWYFEEVSPPTYVPSPPP
jgi:hypothetical protein